ncbi:Crp/Fnr family transcriptional regulator [Microvirga sp. GCM10011540]|uniref:Crp/Fnr family transcriptional regulator n=1 Tax=Microvirga sp. GCM10011540 TaxID=3317338 RepID=UPI003613A839
MTELAKRSPFLRGFEQLFALSSDELDFLHRLESQSKEASARRPLLGDGKSYDYALIVLQGWLIEYKILRDGRRQVLNFRLPGEIAGIDSLAYAAIPHSVAPLVTSKVAVLPLETFHDLQREYPRLGSVLFLMTLREEAILHQWEVRLGRRDAYARIAHLFMELYRRLHLRGLTDGPSFHLPATQEDIADCTGLTTPYVNRILQRMRRDGLLRFDGQVIELLDAPHLAEVSGFKPGYIEDWGNGIQPQRMEQAQQA